MKAKLLRKVRRGCAIEMRGNEYRFVSPAYRGSWGALKWAMFSYREYVLFKARYTYKPKKTTILRF